MTRIQILSVSSAALALALAACNEPTLEAAPTSLRQYGAAQKVGNGTVRTYIVTDRDGRTPIEVGVAMSEAAMEGLPAAMAAVKPATGEPVDHAAMQMQMNMYLLELPANNPTPYKFVQFDWNPAGHEPAGVYDLPHFDFHFYTVTRAVRDAIVPSNPDYGTKAASFPAPEYRAPFYVDAATPAGAPPAAVTVPQMGLHWLDVRSPELQGMTGHPENFKAFTKTFIYGSWDGQFIFDEPMITRAYILAKHDATDPTVRDEIIPVSTASKRLLTGFAPAAYRIAWDAPSKEYRIALLTTATR
jgi:hypothetical protein